MWKLSKKLPLWVLWHLNKSQLVFHLINKYFFKLVFSNANCAIVAVKLLNFLCLFFFICSFFFCIECLNLLHIFKIKWILIQVLMLIFFSALHYLFFNFCTVVKFAINNFAYFLFIDVEHFWMQISINLRLFLLFCIFT